MALTFLPMRGHVKGAIKPCWSAHGVQDAACGLVRPNRTLHIVLARGHEIPHLCWLLGLLNEVPHRVLSLGSGGWKSNSGCQKGRASSDTSWEAFPDSGGCWPSSVFLGLQTHHSNPPPSLGPLPVSCHQMLPMTCILTQTASC